MKGNVVESLEGLTNDFKKFWSAICKKAIQPDTDSTVIEAHYVLSRAQEEWEKDLEYHDSVLNVMEVPKVFPTGFYMQPVIKERQWIISGACYANSMVQDLWNKKLDDTLRPKK